MTNAQELEGDELLAALGIEPEEPETGGYTPRQERLLAGFEDVLRFRETNGRAPRHGEHLDIFERLYAVRLDQLRKLPEDDLVLLRPLDRFGLLREPEAAGERAETLSDDELLAALTDDDPSGIGMLVHVQPLEAKRESAESAEYVAERVTCEDFDLYRPLFEAAEADLAAGRRVKKPFEKDASIEQGDFFVLDGQMVYVAAVGETFKTANAHTQARLRVIYSNGTESNILLRSLQRGVVREAAERPPPYDTRPRSAVWGHDGTERHSDGHDLCCAKPVEGPADCRSSRFAVQNWRDRRASGRSDYQRLTRSHVPPGAR